MDGEVLKANKDQLMWLNIFLHNDQEQLKKADRINMTQVEVVALKRRISQLEAAIVAIQRGLPLTGADLLVARFHLWLADLNIAVRKRKMTWDNFYQAAAKLRAWLRTELRVRGERLAA